MCKKLMFLVSLVAVLSLAVTVQAEYLTNPGFETGAEDPWYNYTETGGTTAIQSGNAHSGDYWWQETSGTGFISGLQDIGVPVDEPVTITAYLRNSGESAVDVELGFDYSPDPMAAPWWYGHSVRGITVPADNTWNLYSFTEFDTSAPGYVDSAITSRPTDSFIMKAKIALITGSSTLDIDDVSVIPEPATIALLGLGGVALLRRKRAH